MAKKINLNNFTHSVKNSLGKNFAKTDYSDIKTIIKGNNLTKGSVEEATGTVEKILNRRSEIEKAFSKGVSIGPADNNLIVPGNGKAHKAYNRYIGNKNMSSSEAVERVSKNLNAKDANALFEREENRFARQKKIEETRKKVSETRSKLDRSAISHEINKNYSDPKLASEIADTIEARGGYVGKERILTPTERLQGRTPDVDNIISTRELKKNRYNDKESYMKWTQGKKYDEAIDAFRNKDFNNPLLKQLEDKNIKVQDLKLENLEALRQDAIQRVSAKDMKFMDTMGYYKAPQIATGVLGTAWLVNKMAATGGEMTNSQLYGQTQY